MAAIAFGHVKKEMFCGLPIMSLLGSLVNSIYQFDIGTGRNEK
jgi:hypothetical protein